VNGLRYGNHSKKAGYREFTNVNVSELFGEFPDVMGIKAALEQRRLKLEMIRPHFEKVVKKARDYLAWKPEERLSYAVIVASCLVAQELKTNQVRRILEMARNVELKLKRNKDEDIRDDIVRIRYVLAYTVGRATGRSKNPLEAFHKILDPMLEVLMKDPKKENFEKFYDFLQAVVAYHRFFGGKD